MKSIVVCLLACTLLIFCGCERATSPEFEYTVDAVQITPESGTITLETPIVMTVPTIDAEIHYSLNGQLPTLNSPLYSAPFSLSGVGRRVIMARTFLNGWIPSPVTKVDYWLPHSQPEMVSLPGVAVTKTADSGLQRYAN